MLVPVLKRTPAPEAKAVAWPGTFTVLEKPALAASTNEACIVPALSSSSWFHAAEA